MFIKFCEKVTPEMGTLALKPESNFSIKKIIRASINKARPCFFQEPLAINILF